MKKFMLCFIIFCMSLNSFSMTEEEKQEREKLRKESVERLKQPWTTKKTGDSLELLPEFVLNALKAQHGSLEGLSIPNIVRYHPSWCEKSGDSRIATADYDGDESEDTAFWLKAKNEYILYVYETSTSSLVLIEEFKGEEKDIPILSADLEGIHESRIWQTKRDHNLLVVPETPTLIVINACYEKGSFSEYFKALDGRYLARDGGC